MPGETDLHKTLKKEGCRWLFRMGYRCIAAEVKLSPVGIIDAVGTGLFRAYHNYLGVAREMHQVCFIECKASRSDFLRDVADDGQMTLWLGEREEAATGKTVSACYAWLLHCQRSILGSGVSNATENAGRTEDARPKS
jgi:hypothetical protein